MALNGQKRWAVFSSYKDTNKDGFMPSFFAVQLSGRREDTEGSARLF